VSSFNNNYKKLNQQQREAVDIIYGPLLVIAGPGTGKTQLLSTRVANILQKTDTLPNNILCLTYTDNASRNMRERLENIIGQPAFHVNISTFHGFCLEVINRYQDYFTKRPLSQQVDELGSYQILHQIFSNLPHDNLLHTRLNTNEFIYLKSTQKIIGYCKQNALLPNDLKIIVDNNEKFFKHINPLISEVFSFQTSTKLIDKYKSLILKLNKDSNVNIKPFNNYGSLAGNELAEAINNTDLNKKPAPKITKWRNKWCRKNANNNFVFKDSELASNKMRAVIDIYNDYENALKINGLYDFDDLIIETLKTLKEHKELLYNLQEQFQFILVDEFQDTNKSQLGILNLLTDNPTNENQPNIMVVGDDDQAIYAFQGASNSNMVNFINSFNNVKTITLTKNYRNTKEILNLSRHIIKQSNDRLEDLFDYVDKTLKPIASYSSKLLEHNIFKNELQQYHWVAKQIKKYINSGTKPSEIAVICTKHKYLEGFLPYIASESIPIAYEKKENILDEPIIKQIITISNLIETLAHKKYKESDNLLSEVLSYPFWNINNDILINLSVKCYRNNKFWVEELTNTKDGNLNIIMQWLNKLVSFSFTEPLEYMIDQILGSTPATDHEFYSPMKEYYFGNNELINNPENYINLMGKLASLRNALRSYKANNVIYNKDLIEFVNLHSQANIKIIDTNPITQKLDAVSILSAHKAKGLEFEVVFIINVQDDVWGPTTGQFKESIRLPLNLPIKPIGDSIDDQLRIFYVALTRAKNTLHLTAYEQDKNNKTSPGLSFIINDNPQKENHLLPQKVHSTISKGQAISILDTNWSHRFTNCTKSQKNQLKEIINQYKLSATHLNNFLDVTRGGPHYFLIHNLLRFPQSMSPSAIYGDAIHKTLQWIYADSNRDIKKITEYYKNIINSKQLSVKDVNFYEKKGINTLREFIKTRKDDLRIEAIVEKNFANEGVIINKAHLTGKIDKITNINSSELIVTDYKTGKSIQSWKGKDNFEKHKLHKFEQQLMFYKLLIENSASFSKKYKINTGFIDFVEPNEQGLITKPLKLIINKQEFNFFINLINVVWDHIVNLNFPDTSQYKPDYSGVLKFESDLIRGKI
jgi:DNA helicase-2/ATP-dependent DNA helicase PcrA